MFKFKKETSLLRTINEPTRASSIPQATVAEIHCEFYTASDKAEDEANKILIKPNQQTIRARKLRELGFIKTPEVVADIDLLIREQYAKGVRQSIHFWQAEYPTLKFILLKDVMEICKRHGLVCGAVYQYKGIVPEKNLIEIEANRRLVDKKHYTIIFSRTDYDSRDFSPKENIAYAINTEDNTVVGTRQLCICAPLRDMDMTGQKIEDGYKSVAIDPVVMQPVSGGYLILSAWGEEASDENVVNQKMN